MTGPIVPAEPTTGLLVSMALRVRHDFGLDAVPDSPIPMGWTAEGRQVLIEQMRRVHAAILAVGTPESGGVRLPQDLSPESVARIADQEAMIEADVERAFEEISGKGFYRTEREAFYVAFIVRPAALPAC